MRRRFGMGLAAGALALTTLGLGGCGSDATERTDARYCATIQQHLAELNAPNIATAGDVTKTLELYRSMSKVAPLAVEKEWDILTIAYETASTVVAGDQASMQQAADTIRAAQQSARAISDYTQRLCNAQIGPSIVATTLLAGTTTTDPDAPATTAGASTSAAGPTSSAPPTATTAAP